MSAIPAGERGAHHALIRRLTAEVLVEFREMPDGLAFRFEAGEYEAVTTFVQHERLCCPFLRFSLEVEAEQGPVWLRLTGPEGVKPFIRAELGLQAT